MTTKVCSKCKVKKEVSDFHKRKDTKYGVSNVCKQCRHNEYKASYTPSPVVRKIHNITHVCNQCGIEKGGREYYSDVTKKKGIREICIKCTLNNRKYHKKRERSDLGKICPCCKLDKSLDDFGRRKDRPAPYCKECARGKTRVRERAFPEKKKERWKDYYKRNKDKRHVAAKKWQSSNKDLVSKRAKTYRAKAIDELKDSYILSKLRDVFPVPLIKEYPDLMEIKRLQIKNKRVLDKLKNNQL
jgi:hypothetical protein